MITTYRNLQIISRIEIVLKSMDEDGCLIHLKFISLQKTIYFQSLVLRFTFVSGNLNSRLENIKLCVANPLFSKMEITKSRRKLKFKIMVEFISVIFSFQERI